MNPKSRSIDTSRINERGSRFRVWQGPLTRDDGIGDDREHHGSPGVSPDGENDLPEPRHREAAVPVASTGTHRRDPESPVSVLMDASDKVSGSGFLPTPRVLFEGGIPGLMEQTLPGLWATFNVLIFFAEKRHHHVWASTTTLVKLMGIAKTETLERRLKKLRHGDKRTGLPPVLRRGKRIEFRPDGLRQLVALARRAVEEEKTRQLAIKAVRARAGRIGMQARWGQRHNKQAARRD